MKYPQTILNLIECFKKLPGIGEKSAERMALSTLNMDEEILALFSNTLLDIPKKIKHCKQCNNLCEGDLCEICKSPNRDHNVICVVEEVKNVNLFEKVGTYNGLYHVLGGLISPLDNITPEDININQLIERVKKSDVKEVILAIKPSIEGETTALYISKILENSGVKVSKIAHGVPIGVDMEYIDSLTLELALEDRTEIS
jgi:recombination protein recR